MTELPPGVRFSDSAREYDSAEALPLLVVEAPECRAVLALQGAQLLSFVPAGDSDWLWLSPKARFEQGQALRGGIPLCLPWFGVNRRQPELPKHGLVRQRPWQLQGVERCGSEFVLSLSCQSGEQEAALFPWRYRAEIEYRLGAELVCELSIYNQGKQPMPLSFALHSYFAADIRRAGVTGLGRGVFLDNTRGLETHQLTGEQRFDGQVDRVFEGVGGCQSLLGGHRSLAISGRGCDTVVLWNPGEELAGQLDDVGRYYSDYVCVERGMAFADELLLAPGASHQAQMKVAGLPIGQ